MEKEKKAIYKKWWFWIVIVLVVGSIGSAVGVGSDDTETTKESTVKTESNKAEKDTETSKTTEAKTETTNDLIIKKGHPKLYDSIISAHYFYTDEETSKIYFSDEYDNFDTDMVIGYECGLTDKIIKQIELYPTDCDYDKAVEILKGYIDIDTIKNYYKKEYSYYQVKDDVKAYFILYVPKDKYQDRVEEMGYNYFGVYMEFDNDIASVIRIQNTNPWNNNLDLDTDNDTEIDFSFE